MKNKFIAFFIISLITSPVFSQRGTTTDVLGGGTPGREDKSRMSKKMYGYEDTREKRELVNEVIEEMEEQEELEEHKEERKERKASEE